MKEVRTLALTGLIGPTERTMFATGHARRLGAVVGWAFAAMITPFAANAAPPCEGPNATLLVSGLEELQGSAVGPGGALFVTAPLAGSIWRVDPETGAVTLFASGLPARIPGLLFIGSGVADVAFIGGTAYALVTGVAPDMEGDDVVGIYRVDGPNSFTVVADLGAWSIAHPPADFWLPTGFQYAIEPFRGGFLVTDGHHNRVLRVTRDGEITELIAFGDVVPTGLAVSGNSIYVAQAGPIPHEPEDGRVVVFGPNSTTATEVAAGAGWPSTWSLATGARSSPSRRASGTARTRGLRRCRTPARSCGSTGTAPSRPSSAGWTSRPRSRSSRTPPTLSPSPGRSGRSKESSMTATAMTMMAAAMIATGVAIAAVIGTSPGDVFDH
jgi:hypothetical protein